MHRKQILYIDDEENNLTSFKAAMRRDFLVHTARDAKEAELVLQSQPDIKVLVVDHGLPQITGLAFLESIRQTFPDPVRIILTGQADVNLMIDAINRVNLFRFILKPWDSADLKQSIESAILMYDSRKEIREQQKELQRAYEQLNRLVYSASHEMRSPLTSIKGLLDLSATENNPDTLHSYLRMMRQSAEVLDDFVTNLLYFHQNASLENTPEPIDLNVLCMEVVDQLRDAGNEAVEFALKNDVMLPIQGDLRRIRMVLSNLLSNAFKFHRVDIPDPKAECRFSLDQDKLIIEISDNGKGIPSEILSKLFDMFSRGPDQNTGSGVGLFVVKEITQALNGRIDVQSEWQKGTVFRVEIPISIGS